MKRITIYIIMIILIGCGGSNIGDSVGLDEGITIYDIAKDGWYYYENGEYELALAKFDRTVKLNDKFEDGFNGLGWTYLAIQDVSLARSNFDRMTNLNENLTDGWVGKSFASFELGLYEESNEAVINAISQDSAAFDLIIPDYIFSHNSTVSARALRIVMALNYFYLGNFNESYFILNEYIKKVRLIPEAEDFPEKLLSELEKL